MKQIVTVIQSVTCKSMYGCAMKNKLEKMTPIDIILWFNM